MSDSAAKFFAHTKPTSNKACDSTLSSLRGRHRCSDCVAVHPLIPCGADSDTCADDELFNSLQFDYATARPLWEHDIHLCCRQCCLDKRLRVVRVCETDVYPWSGLHTPIHVAGRRLCDCPWTYTMWFCQQCSSMLFRVVDAVAKRSRRRFSDNLHRLHQRRSRSYNGHGLPLLCRIHFCLGDRSRYLRS